MGADKRKGVSSIVQSIFNYENAIMTRKMMDVSLLRHEAYANNIENEAVKDYKRVSLDKNFEVQLQYLKLDSKGKEFQEELKK